MQKSRNIPNVSINIMIIQHRPHLRILIHPLPTRPIHIIMAPKHQRAAMIQGTPSRRINLHPRQHSA